MKHSNTFLFFVKRFQICLAVVVVFVVCLLALRALDQVPYTLKPGNPFEALILEHAWLQAEGRVAKLNYIMPAFQPLKQALENGEPDAATLQPYCGYFESIKEAYPDRWTGYYMMGVCRAQNRRWNEAWDYFSHAYDLNKQYIGIYYNLGVVALYQRDYLKAYGILTHIRGLRPEDSVKSLYLEKTFVDITIPNGQYQPVFHEKIANTFREAETLLRFSAMCAGSERDGHLMPLCGIYSGAVRIF